MKYTVKTTPFTDGKILQIVDLESQNIIQTIMRDVLYTKEKQVKEALIKLGWTPPNATKTNQEVKYTICGG